MGIGTYTCVGCILDGWKCHFNAKEQTHQHLHRGEPSLLQADSFCVRHGVHEVRKGHQRLYCRCTSNISCVIGRAARRVSHPVGACHRDSNSDGGDRSDGFLALSERSEAVWEKMRCRRRSGVSVRCDPPTSIPIILVILRRI